MPDKAVSSTEEKAFWHVLWPLFPPPPNRAEVKLLVSAEMLEDDGFRWHAFFMGRSNKIDAIGASVPTWFMKSDNLYHEFASKALNRLFAAMSMMNSFDARLLDLSTGHYLSIGIYSDDELPSAYPLHIEIPPQSANWDFYTIFKLVGQDDISDELLGALSEATHESIPRHYRFLALCRALELLLPDPRALSDWLNKYEEEFRALDIDRKKFRNCVAELRNRCAHGQAGGKLALFGTIERHVTLMSHGVPTCVFNLLMKATIELLNEHSSLKLRAPRIPEEVPNLMSGRES